MTRPLVGPARVTGCGRDRGGTSPRRPSTASKQAPLPAVTDARCCPAPGSAAHPVPRAEQDRRPRRAAVIDRRDAVAAHAPSGPCQALSARAFRRRAARFRAPRPRSSGLRWSSWRKAVSSLNVVFGEQWKGHSVCHVKQPVSESFRKGHVVDPDPKEDPVLVGISSTLTKKSEAERSRGFSGISLLPCPVSIRADCSV